MVARKAIDLWAVGCILFFAITGQEVIDATTMEESKAKHVDFDITRKLQEPNLNGMNEHAKELLCGLLDSDPQTRLGTSSALDICERWLLNSEAAGDAPVNQSSEQAERDDEPMQPTSSWAVASQEELLKLIDVP